jgi:hypothetical protein
LSIPGTLTDLARHVRENAAGHQTVHCFSGGRTIASPAWHENAFEKSGMFESGPFTRQRGVECGSTRASIRLTSGRREPHHTWA